jgi:hypothetical protein
MKTEQVIVIWGTKESAAQGMIHTLDSYNGTRIYERDRVDARLLLGRKSKNIPYFPTMQEAVQYISTNFNDPVQIPLSVGKAYSLV